MVVMTGGAPGIEWVGMPLNSPQCPGRPLTENDPGPRCQQGWVEGPQRPGGHLPISELPVSQPVVLGPARDHLSRLREGKAVPLSSAQGWMVLLALGKKIYPHQPDSQIRLPRN